MSATIDSKLFAEYFSVPIGDELSPAPVLSVQGRTYEVNEFYLDDLRQLGEVRAEYMTISIKMLG